MPASLINILQIGDIHYPDLIKLPRPIDAKDNGFAPGLLNAMALPPLQTITRHLQHLIDDHAVHGIAFMGDLTSLGDKDGYRNCLKFINEKLVKGRWLDSERDKIIFVPGNHDIKRSDVRQKTLYFKFSRINKLLAEFGFRSIPLDSPNKFVFTGDLGTKLHLYALNTCIGCGEKRFLPKTFQSVIQRTISQTLKKAKSSSRLHASTLKYVTETLDTPAVNASSIQELIHSIEEYGSSEPALICSHHNILPQVIPRTEIYTELLNSGMLRKSLLSTDRPILYLHGHIHEDPIDVLRDPRFENGTLISISAPLFQDGFNIIGIAFSNSKIPLGCEIKRYKYINTGQIHLHESIPISFWRNADAGGVLSELSRLVISKLPNNSMWYFPDIRSQVLESLSIAPKDADIKDALTELRWLNLIRIEYQHLPVQRWRISKII